MSDSDSSAIEAFSKVVNNLINKISSAIGWVFTHDTPNRIAIQTYIEEIERSNLPPLHKAAAISRAKKDIKEYANQCKIVDGAFVYIKEDAKPDDVEDDWITQFFDKSKLVSDEEVQLIWSKLLAEECNKPGSVPKSLLFILERMDREDADIFMKLCSITIKAYNDTNPLVINTNNNYLLDLDLSFDKLIQMESMGLIRFSTDSFNPGFAVTPDDDNHKSWAITYFNNRYDVPYDIKTLPIGNVLFTKGGVALYHSVKFDEREGFWEQYVVPWIQRVIQNQHK